MNSGSSLRKLAVKDTLTKIQNGTIRPDDIITEAQICESLGISRTPVREALIEMVKDGILKRVPRKGYAINEMDQKHKLNVYDILAALDALAAKLALPNLTEEDLHKMEEFADLIDVSIKYKNYPSYCELQDNFHLIYINKCDNPPLINLLEEIKSTVSRITYYSSDDDRLFETCSQMNSQHREIIRFFKEKDSVKLSEYLAEVHWKTHIPDMI